MAPKIFFPLPLVSVKETSETPFEKSARPRKYLSRRGVAKILIGLQVLVYVSTSGGKLFDLLVGPVFVVITRSDDFFHGPGLSAGLGASVAHGPTALKIRRK